MGETEILERLSRELRLDDWWLDLLGQAPNIPNFDLNLAEERIPRTELLAGEEIKRKFGNTLSFTEKNNRWYVWDGIIHTPCDGEGLIVKVIKIYFKAVTRALEFVKEAIEDKAKKQAAGKTSEATKKAAATRELYNIVFGKHRKFRDKLADSSGMAAMVRTLRTECDVPGDYFENDQRWFVMRNWTLDLDVLRNEGNFLFVPHSPHRPVTKYFDADYDVEANLGHFDRFLETSIPNENMRNYLQVVTGAAFMGESKLRCIPNLSGPPGSGKSVYLGLLHKLGMKGARYCVAPDSRAITKVNSQNFEQDEFRGARAVLISEPSHTEPVDDDFLKKVSGDDWIESRTLNTRSTGWIPQCIVFIASNKPLKINTRDKAIVDRFQLIEFPIHFEKDHPDESRRLIPKIEDKLMDDRARVLIWILQGMRKFILEEGRKLTPPDDVKTLGDDLVVDGSSALRWVQDYITQELLVIDYTVPDTNFIAVDEAYQRYTVWCMTNGEKKPLPKRFFAQDIENRYGEKTKGKNPRFIGILPTTDYNNIYHRNESVGASELHNQYGF